MTDAPDLPDIDRARAEIDAATDGAALSDLAGEWRAAADMEALLALAKALWRDGSDVEKIVAAKLLTKARIEDDSGVWAALVSWAETLDAPNSLPALAAAGARRVAAHPGRLSEIEGWTSVENPLTRAAALGFTQSLAKERRPAPDIAAARERAAAWAVSLSHDPEAAPRKAAIDILVSLVKHDPRFLDRLIEAEDALPAGLLKRLKRASRGRR